MKEQFLTYEQALELKELGFKKKCNMGWAIGNNDQKRLVITNDEKYLSAPTYQQAFDFIREQFGYNYFIKAFGKDTYTFFIEKWKWKHYENDFKLPYEEARARCLDKLIEIINND